MNKRLSKGFTLVELLVVIGILAVLLTLALVAINPARQFAQANNTKRRSDVSAILNGVHQYAADNKGALPTGITTTATLIRKTADATDTEADICASLVTKYLAALPVDPLTNNGTAVTDCTTDYTTNYTISKSAADNRVTVTATAAELSESISITR